MRCLVGIMQDSDPTYYTNTRALKTFFKLALSTAVDLHDDCIIDNHSLHNFETLSIEYMKQEGACTPLSLQFSNCHQETKANRIIGILVESEMKT